MALLGYEGWDDAPTSISTGYLANWINPPAGNWTAPGTANKVAGQLGGGAMQPGTVQLTLTSPVTTIIHGVRYRIDGTAFTTSLIMQFLDSAGAAQCGISINSSGFLIAWRGTTANILGTGTTQLALLSYIWLEVKILVSTTVGTVLLKLNGNTELNLSGVNTQATGNANIGGQQWSGPGGSYSFDDQYWCDTSGGAPYNDILGGPLRVETLFPTANSAVAFTPLSSTNVSQVQEANFDSDTTYNFAASSAVDTFTHGSLSSTPTTIFGVTVTAEMRKDDVTSINCRTKLNSGVTNSNGASHQAMTSYLRYRDVYLTDPNTGSAWLPANVNATVIGYERI